MSLSGQSTVGKWAVAGITPLDSEAGCRFLYFVVALLVVVLGLASRRYAAVLPIVFAQYAGDTLWAVMVFVGVGLLVPRWSSLRVALVALMVSYFVECSQLYHSPWVDTLRRTRVGGLVLGYGFLWSDFACYTVGVALGAVLEIGAWKAAEWRRNALSVH